MKTLFEKLPQKEKDILMNESFTKTMVIEPLKKVHYVSDIPLDVAYHLTVKLYNKIEIDMNQLFKLFKDEQ